jgi:hypothetical protein
MGFLETTSESSWKTLFKHAEVSTLHLECTAFLVVIAFQIMFDF